MKEIIKNSHYKIQQIIKKFTGSYNEDLEQEVYLRVLKSKNYVEKNKFSNWIATITSNLCRDFLKSSYFRANSTSIRDEEFLEKAILERKTPEKEYSTKERQKIILKEINKLPKKMKETLILYEFEDYSYEKISSKLNISIGTVKSRINSARKILKEKLSFLLQENIEEL